MKAQTVGHLQQNSDHYFNVYQSKHPREAKGWGLVRSLFKELKVKRKMENYLKKPANSYCFINRMDVPKKRKEAL